MLFLIFPHEYTDCVLFLVFFLGKLLCRCWDVLGILLDPFAPAGLPSFNHFALLTAGFAAGFAAGAKLNCVSCPKGGALLMSFTVFNRHRIFHHDLMENSDPRRIWKLTSQFTAKNHAENFVLYRLAEELKHYVASPLEYLILPTASVEDQLKATSTAFGDGKAMGLLDLGEGSYQVLYQLPYGTICTSATSFTPPFGPHFPIHQGSIMLYARVFKHRDSGALVEGQPWRRICKNGSVVFKTVADAQELAASLTKTCNDLSTCFVEEYRVSRLWITQGAREVVYCPHGTVI